MSFAASLSAARCVGDILRRACLANRFWLLLLGWYFTLPSFAYVLQRDETGRPLHVNFTRTPKLTYHLGTTGSVRGVRSNEWVNVRAAAAQWQAVPGTQIRFEEGAGVGSVAQIPAVDGRIDILWVNPGTYPMGPDFGGTSLTLFNTGQVAVTYLFTDEFDTDVILQAVILIRRDLDYTTSYTEPSANRPFLETVILHELGHVLGANHSPMGTSTLWWYSGGGANAAAGLSTDEVAFAQHVYGTTATRAGLGRITGSVRLNNTPQLGAIVLLERTNGLLVSAAVTRANGLYELPGLTPGTYQLRAVPLDPNGSSDASLVRGADLDVTSAAEYALANTSFQGTPPIPVTVAGNSTQTRDFTVSGPAAAVRITEIRQGLQRTDRASADLALQLAPGMPEAWVGVYVPGAVSTNATLRIIGEGVRHGATEVLPGALRQLTLVQVPVSVSASAPSGPRTLEVSFDGKVARAFGFVEILPAFPDDNFDGLSDLFQRTYWSPFTTAQGAPGLDPDGDGYSNQREADAGTNPLSKTSYQLTVGLRRSGASIIVNASVGVGLSYQLLAKGTLSGTWQPVGGIRIAGSPTLEWVEDPASSGGRFYQVRRGP